MGRNTGRQRVRFCVLKEHREIGVAEMVLTEVGRKGGSKDSGGDDKK